MISRLLWKWFGTAGHLCVSDYCRFHLATEIGDYLISTVGEYFRNDDNEMTEIGLGRNYETMVFLLTDEVCDCGCGMRVPDLSEIEMIPANTRMEANENHRDLCLKYAILGDEDEI